MKMQRQLTRPLGHSKGHAKRKVYSRVPSFKNQSYPKEMMKECASNSWENTNNPNPLDREK
jgi:hypothetical protein